MVLECAVRISIYELLKGSRLNAEWLAKVIPSYRMLTRSLQMRPRQAIIWFVVHELGKDKPEGISLSDIASFSDASLADVFGFAEEFRWLDRRGYIVEVGLHKQPLSLKRYRCGKGY
jgi:hypothetical protein